MLDQAGTVAPSPDEAGQLFVHGPASVGQVQSRSSRPRAGEVEWALHERLKELDCLYGISRLIDRHANCLDEILQGIVDLIPPSWQYPGVCCARLVLYNRSYSTDNFRETNWRQSSEIRVGGESVGRVEICYLAQRPDHDEGPFLREERSLIDAISERTGKVVERIQMAGRLEADRVALEETNSALRRVLVQIEEEKKAMRKSIADNAEKILMPALHALENQVPAHHKPCVSQIKRDLENIASSFANRLSIAFATLTPVEIKICKMIRDGLGTNEIAQLRNVSPSTVTKQREQIRRKLQLQGTGTNLASYLLTFGMEEGSAVLQ